MPFGRHTHLVEYARLAIWWAKGKPIQGRPNPAPYEIKIGTVKKYAAQFCLPIFVETGTLRGDMIAAVQDACEEVYSIEVDSALWKQAIERFRGKNHIKILQGDSRVILPQILLEISRPCLFWLDAHTDTDSPVLAELDAIANSDLKRYVILIDDARMFRGNGWPNLSDVMRALPECHIENDMIVKAMA